MKKLVRLTDTTLRDAHQSLWATRLKTDEMIPILISNGVSLKEILQLVLIQMLIAIVSGFIIDLFTKKKKEENIILEIFVI